MIFLRGDLHGGVVGELDYLTPERNPELFSLTKKDYLIILGDFGCIWDQQRTEREIELLERIKAFPWTTLFFVGNHDNFDRLLSDEFKHIPMFENEVAEIYDDIYMLISGQRYLIDGKSFFIVGGAASIDKQYRILGVSWWPQEELSLSQWNEVLEKAESIKKVDYILAHDVPARVFNILKHESHFLDKTESMTTRGLERVIQRLEYVEGFSGHYHIEKHFPQFNWHILYNNIIQLT